MSRLLVILSGNAGVGKSTLGPYLATELNAVWLSESDTSSAFAHLFAREERSARIISQMAFSSMRVATILSSLLSGTNEIVVAERYLRDSLLYHELWRDKFSLQDMDEFFNKFYKTLDIRPFDYATITIWLKCDINVLLKRISLRGEIFEHVHTKQFLVNLEEKYTNSFKTNPPENLMVFDVTELSNDPYSLKSFASTIASKLRELGI